MDLNLYEIIIPNKVRRVFYYNPEVSPDIFAANMSRVNNLKFIHSSDLVWVELPFIQVNLIPKESEKYRKAEEIIENDSELFIKTLYRYIQKTFKDNGFIPASRHLYASVRSKTPLTTNPEVSFLEAYQIKIYAIDKKFYLSINPRLVFLSTKPALESRVRSAYLLNIISGRSFPFIEIKNGKLVLQINEQFQKEVTRPENYFFNFSMKEAQVLGFSKDFHKLYRDRTPSLFNRIPTDLTFLNGLVDLDKPYHLDSNDVKIIYRFSRGDSEKVDNIFQLGPLSNPGELKLAFIFPENLGEEKKIIMKNLISNDSLYVRSLRALGFRKIHYFQNLNADERPYCYREEDFELPEESRKKLESAPRNTTAIVLLPKWYGGLGQLLKKFPKNLIILPALISKIVEGQAYILKSFAYKTLNFTPNSQAYRLVGLSDGALYIGFDLSHDRQKRRSDYAFAAVDSDGKVLLVVQKLKLPLNEKMDTEKLISDTAKSINLYTSLKGSPPKIIFLMRDGVFIEDTSELKSQLDLFKIKYVIVEINKNCNINSSANLKGKMVELDRNRYVYFAETYNLQKGVEVNIHTNKSDLSEWQIAREVYLSTRLYHPTPYVSLKLPYPLYITDKVSLLKDEWILYVPYFRD